ncbi:galectin-3-like [Penaeus japonicus]|uniref:galectin-3-like n=1 Tax=Penaeus japonicus TaxID=27405 RepID=UPI001C712718|nr:galectin-3-like [Penaeus japonicus]XP_042892211.1 galectin-3-like [Penaeus japonicus]
MRVVGCLAVVVAALTLVDGQFITYGVPGQGLVDRLNGLINGGGFPGQGGGHFPGQGGHFPGQGGHFPGQGGNYPGQTSCTYWCRTPENQYYCCDRGNNQGQGNYPGTKPGYCPAVRDVCPPTRFGVNRPTPCAHDSQCIGFSDKCCFDRCLGEHVCKPASSYFGR